MRRPIAMIGGAALLTIFPATPALADGAIIDKESGTCQMIVPDASGLLTGAEVEGSLLIRENKSWITMTCHFDLTEEQSPPKATHARGFSCGIPPHGSTTDTRASASSGGRMVLTCRIKK